jgi:hypothetical protein
MICSLIDRIFERMPKRMVQKSNAINDKIDGSKSFSFFRTISMAAIGISLVGLQLFSKNLSTWKMWTESGDGLTIFIHKPFEIYGRFTNFQEDAARWLKKNAPRDAKIMADGFTNEGLDFYEAAAYRIPVIHPVREFLISQNSPSIQGKTRPLFLFTYSSFDSGIDRARGLYAVFEEDILTAIKAEVPNFIVLSGRSLFLRVYLERASWAQLAFDNQRVVVFRIQPDRAMPVPLGPLGVNEEIEDHIAWLEKNHPEDFPFFLKTIAALNLTLDDLKNSPLRIPKGQSY